MFLFILSYERPKVEPAEIVNLFIFRPRRRRERGQWQWWPPAEPVTLQLLLSLIKWAPYPSLIGNLYSLMSLSPKMVGLRLKKQFSKRRFQKMKTPGKFLNPYRKKWSLILRRFTKSQFLFVYCNNFFSNFPKIFKFSLWTCCRNYE